MILSHITWTRPVEDGAWERNGAFVRVDLARVSTLLGVALAAWLLFLTAGPVLQFIDPRAGVLDIGILSILFFGLLAGLTAILCCFWLQELLWQPFKYFRQNFQSHFNQLTSWQQSILYFSVFFLSLYAVLWVLGMVL